MQNESRKTNQDETWFIITELLSPHLKNTMQLVSVARRFTASVRHKFQTGTHPTLVRARLTRQETLDAAQNDAQLVVHHGGILIRTNGNHEIFNF